MLVLSGHPALGTALLNWAWIVPVLGHRGAESLAAPCDFTQLCISPSGEQQGEQGSSQLCQMAQQSMGMVLGWTAKDSTLPESRSTTSQHLTLLLLQLLPSAAKQQKQLKSFVSIKLVLHSLF